MKIETIPVELLIPYARNAKLHDDAQIAAIAASLREFGFCNPVLIDADNGIIAGHGRVLAARKLDMQKVPCVRLGHLSDVQRRAYILADNRLAEIGGGWDVEMLALEIEDLRLEDFDLDLTGWDQGALSEMLEGDDVEPIDDMPGLPDGDKEPFQQMTFTLHDEQAEQVSAALSAAKSLGPFEGSPNENSNGNALARICETFLTAYA